MHFSSTAVVASALALAGSALADSHGAPTTVALTISSSASGGGSAVAASAPSGTGSAPGAGVSVHVVRVSNKDAKLFYEPAEVKANVGDMVQYQFYPKNHSVVQSSFDAPCVPLSKSTPGSQGFYSGFMPVSANASTTPTYTIQVKDTKPIWFYCSQAKHCQGGMVGVINPPAANQSRTLESFKALAAKAPENLSPDCDAASNSTKPSSSGISPSAVPTTLSTTPSTPTAATPPAIASSAGPAQVTTNAASSLNLPDRGSHLASAGLIALVVGLFL
ncbi:MAG: hypothetical protein M1832_003743 [Thelocarpon impressellum]|nr:MAG: hypothetical protein M1832_003743 [Thelocarpon impressellum]